MVSIFKMIKQIARWILKEELSILDNKIIELQNQVNNSALGTPKVIGKITIEELADIFITKLGIPSTFSDMWFSTTTLEEAFKFVQATNVYNRTYQPEIYDCDNFSMALLGYWNQSFYSFPFGYAIGGSDGKQTHEFNIFVDEKKDVYIVEPQTGIFIPIEQAKTNKLYWPIQMVRI